MAAQQKNNHTGRFTEQVEAPRDWPSHQHYQPAENAPSSTSTSVGMALSGLFLSIAGGRSSSVGRSLVRPSPSKIFSLEICNSIGSLSEQLAHGRSFELPKKNLLGL